ncbi:hypothetical protein DFS34DRAFT_577116 [Phlyctochytrium arcticum]|nr:hypothetical protein DFS34DRAFT_577116 [Phlyctochytrium arcticum]
MPAATSTPLPQSGKAWVKNIISGDTVVIHGKPSNGPPAEKVISLSNLVAPRLGSAKEPEREEPFAFESREFLRRALVGKEVFYTVDYTTTSNQRDFGVLRVQHPIVGEETNVNRAIAKEGWARVKSADGKRTNSEECSWYFVREQELLLEYEKAAEAAGKGVFQDPSLSNRSAKYDMRDEARAFLEQHKGKPIDAIVEQIRDGSTLRVCLLLPERVYITLMLSGFKAPTLRKGIPNMEDVVEEYSEEAKYFVEARLSNRDVKIVLEGLSSNDNFVGSVQYALGNIGEALLVEGLAKVVDWNITLVTGGPGRYRAAEQRAKERKVRLWKNWVGKTKVAGPESEFDAIVTRVLSGDTLLVESVASGKERRIQLSSIRAPKGPATTVSKDSSVKEYSYDLDAREYLRGRCIGKPVHVVIDYVKPAEGSYEARECATVTQGAKNVAEVVVSKGLADIIRHRRDDDNRSSQYDQLLLAHERAQAAQKGIHSTKEAPLHRISDASATVAKARQFFPFLQRAGTVSGVVDFVSSGSRFRIHVPSQNCTLTLVLGGIRAPRAGRPGEQSEPYGPEALDFVNKRAMQREVEFSVESMDKVGGFIGTLYLTINDERKNMAVMLLEEGLASVHDYSASQSANAHQLYEAEKGAKAAKKGIWKDYSADEAAEAAEAASAAQSASLLSSERVTDIKEVLVSHIGVGNQLFLQVMTSDLNRLEKLMADFSIHHDSSSASSVPQEFKPRVGDYVSAQFTADDAWYRARIRKAHGTTNTYNVLYVDYGNSETIPLSRLRPLDPKFSTSTINGGLTSQAVEAKLAYVELPEDDSDEYAEATFTHLREATEGKTLVAYILGKTGSTSGSGQVWNVILYPRTTTTIASASSPNGSDLKLPKSTTSSINESIITEGLGILPRPLLKRYKAELARQPKGEYIRPEDRKAKQTVLDKCVEAEEAAKKARAGRWRYGDFTGDDE